MGWLDECRDKCRQVKFLSEQMDWNDKANHLGSLKATSQLLDHNHASIPGLYFKGVYSPKPLTGDVYSFALMALQGREHHRVFMLEVYPAHVVSHRGKSEWLMGPTSISVMNASNRSRVLCMETSVTFPSIAGSCVSSVTRRCGTMVVSG